MVTLKFDGVQYNLVSTDVLHEENNNYLLNFTEILEAEQLMSARVHKELENAELIDDNNKKVIYDAEIDFYLTIIIKLSELKKAVQNRLQMKDLRYKVECRDIDINSFDIKSVEEGFIYTENREIEDFYIDKTMKAFKTDQVIEHYLDDFYIELVRY